MAIPAKHARAKMGFCQETRRKKRRTHLYFARNAKIRDNSQSTAMIIFIFIQNIYTLFLQLVWRQYPNRAQIQNPSLDKERSRCGLLLQRCARSEVESLARNEREQNLTPPPEGIVKTLVPPPHHRENHDKERSPSSERNVAFLIQGCNIRIICKK